MTGENPLLTGLSWLGSGGDYIAQDNPDDQGRLDPSSDEWQVLEDRRRSQT
jgi:hypothetical protein